jgi:hypothetical protein
MLPVDFSGTYQLTKHLLKEAKLDEDVFFDTTSII